ncbi:MAG: hypothetical protein LBP53_04205 [Candidatus Peribacteria bacterium]|nr:hypothetical protein [Candidatus Peribacteria bacterium]
MKGWTSVDEMTYTKSYATNTTEKVNYADLLGNKSMIEVVISWISQPSN